MILYNGDFEVMFMWWFEKMLMWYASDVIYILFAKSAYSDMLVMSSNDVILLVLSIWYACDVQVICIWCAQKQLISFNTEEWATESLQSTNLLVHHAMIWR